MGNKQHAADGAEASPFASKNHINTTTALFTSLPDDVLTEIFEFAFTLKPKHALGYSLVSKNLYDYFTSARSNIIWRNITNSRWRMVNTQMTMSIGTWYEYYRKRYMAQQKQKKLNKSQALVETCDLQFRCPLVFVCKRGELLFI